MITYREPFPGSVFDERSTRRYRKITTQNESSDPGPHSEASGETYLMWLLNSDVDTKENLFSEEIDMEKDLALCFLAQHCKSTPVGGSRTRGSIESHVSFPLLDW